MPKNYCLHGFRAVEVVLLLDKANVRVETTRCCLMGNCARVEENHSGVVNEHVVDQISPS